ncbi:MAG: 5-dehydro-4-deoxyglucarate dehydratase [Terriglobia bacterium]
MMNPIELRDHLQGLFAFPVTPFTENDEVDLRRYHDHLGFMMSHHPAALFVCGGTGEFFSLNLAEYRALVEAAVEEVRGRLPVIAGAGYGASLAAEFVRAAEEAGADGILLMPPYLVQAEQAGLYEHYRRVAAATRLGVIVYQRDNAIIAPATAARLAEIPNLIGFKDGHGDMERLGRIRLAVGDRLAFMNGMPTAELSAQAFQGLGVVSYSSAVFNFAPEISQAFYKALTRGDPNLLHELLENFFRPLADLRDRKKGYAVSMIKAAVNISGPPVGAARPPLVNLTNDELTELKSIVEKGRSQVNTS